MRFSCKLYRAGVTLSILLIFLYVPQKLPNFSIVRLLKVAERYFHLCHFQTKKIPILAIHFQVQLMVLVVPEKKDLDGQTDGHHNIIIL